MDTNRIEKTVILHGSRHRVWQALSDSTEFGRWFGMKFDRAFSPGALVHGRVTHPGYENLRAEITIERMEPEALLSWRWHPNAIDAKKDYSAEPMTLVTFELSDVSGGTQLTLVESGFDNIPAKRRAEAYRGNEVGWSHQMEAIKRHLAHAA